MTTPDLSEHFGRVGELIIGLIGLLLLSLMHKDVRSFARRFIQTIIGAFIDGHEYLCRRNSFYRNWIRSFRLVLGLQLDILIVVATLIVFDYLATLHSNFMHAHFDLLPRYNSLTTAGKISELVFSAATIFGLLRTFGYTLFCWIAFQIASGAAHSGAVNFRPYRKFIGLFLMIYGIEFIASATAPYYILFAASIFQDAVSSIFILSSVSAGLFLCFLGAYLFQIAPANQSRNTAISALIGYAIITHIVQWYYHWTHFARSHHSPALETLTYHVSNFTFTLLWNIVLVAFAVRLSGPPKAHTEMSHHAANAV